MLQEKKIVKNPIKKGSFNDIYSIGFHGFFANSKQKFSRALRVFSMKFLCFCKVLMK